MTPASSASRSPSAERFPGGSGSGSSLSINGTSYTLLYSMADVQAINGDGTNDATTSAALSGNYALAASLDASSVSNWQSIGTNGHAAWGITAGLTDTVDLFLEEVGPDGASVRQGGGFVPCEVVRERIAVRNETMEGLRFEVSLELAADFADIITVKEHDIALGAPVHPRPLAPPASSRPRPRQATRWRGPHRPPC